MILADDIAAGIGTIYDEQGAMASVTKAIRDAQRFVLEDDVAIACGELAYSKPSTLNAALPMCRLPYPKIWIENRGGLGKLVREGLREDEPGRPTPLRQGALIESVHPSGQAGIITLCWVHREREERLSNLGIPISSANGLSPTVCPFSIYFDWRPEGDVANNIEMFLASFSNPNDELVKYAAKRITSQPRDRLFTYAEMRKVNSLRGHAEDPKEVEALTEGLRRTCLGPSPHGTEMLRAVMEASAREPKTVHHLIANWIADTNGEVCYIESFLAMLNSKNPPVEHTAVDLTRLNKARAKSGKRQFFEHSVTRLKLSRSQQRHADAAGLTEREAARQHWVMGHFKIRRTGVFWWSPFKRGDPTRPMERKQYEVT